ncbi:hypothetical protein HHX48_14285 [Salinimonas sp. HHU 13199]|uniref:Uncharacterized protein n=1 Tax=Salinimonas profundi TaxID=2729140 RepID=A0ABR8LPC9_9ALTE|nr:hypothetical protein [Salinimonas profundi]MBD3586911.1 hypothetical protein [Salinimonas profundi]
MPDAHPFFALPSSAQHIFIGKLVAVSGVIVVAAGTLFYWAGVLPLLLPLLAILLSIIAPFFDVPSLVKNKKLTYVSNFLLIEHTRGTVLTLHTATLFDYYFLFTADMNARERKKRALTGILDGLITLCNDQILSATPEQTVRLTTFVLNERTANKLGMREVSKDYLQTFILYYNYINLTMCQSLLNKRLSLPSVKNIKTYEGSTRLLAENKAYLMQLKTRIA